MKTIPILKGLTLVALTVSAAGCGGRAYTVLTSDQITERGTRTFEGVSLEAAVEMSAASLKTLGYEVTIADAAKGVVKTSPAVIFTQATGTSSYSQFGGTHVSNVQRDGLAWSLSIRSLGAAVQIVARPRAYRNSQELTGDQIFVAEIVDPKFESLWREIGENLGQSPNRPPASKAPTP